MKQVFGNLHAHVHIRTVVSKPGPKKGVSIFPIFTTALFIQLKIIAIISFDHDVPQLKLWDIHYITITYSKC